MKDRGKEEISLRNTKFRISSIQKSIQDAKQRLNCLKEHYEDVHTERNRLRYSISDAPLEASKTNSEQKEILNEKLSEQCKRNTILERHLQHILYSSGLEDNRSNMLSASMCEYFHENSKEVEKLTLAVANAKKLCNTDLISFTTKMLRHGVPESKIDSITEAEND